MVKSGIFLGKRYEVLSKIGAGGMADVYKGKDVMLNRFVAIKVLKKELREDETFVKKFRSEAQAAAGLLNPNIVNVYDVGEDRGLYYMVMELVEGVTLKEYIERKKRLSAREVISIAIQMCNGIEAAHERNIIHRDIKPQNVIISNDGKVKVTDFGIAKATTSNTVTMAAMGSVHYTSPEQARGGYVDAKSDIYSVGITLYEMVTGRVPFDGKSTVEVALKHLQEEITPPSELVPDIPYSLEQIILKCTQKNSERRYASTKELIQDLKHSLVDPEGDFVKLIPQQNADTVIITEDELDNIRSAYEDEDEDYDDDDDEYDDDDDDDDDEEEDEYGGREHGSDEVNPRMNKVMKILTVAVAVIVIIVLAVVVGRASGIFQFGPSTDTETSDEKVKVPNVVGKTKEEAIDILNKAGLGYKLGTEKESTEYEAGTVMEQSPESGEKVAKHTQIELIISSKLVEGEQEVLTVPNVAGMNESDAMKALNDEGFQKITSEAVYNDSEQGTVIGTTPAAGAKGTKDTEIVMQVSKGPKKPDKVSVPDVRGKSENDAKSELTSAKLKAGNVTTEYSDDYEAGLVISQSVAVGEKVEENTSVDLVVSLGNKPIAVPDVAGYTVDGAKEKISAEGLYVSDVIYEDNADVPEGCVISCDPGIGETVSKDTGIVLYVSRGVEITTEEIAPTPRNEAE